MESDRLIGTSAERPSVCSFGLGVSLAPIERGFHGRERGVESPGLPPAKIATFAVSGDYWTIGYGDTTFPLKDIKGLSYLQRLLQHPGEEFHSLDLISGPGSMDLSHSERTSPQVEGTHSVVGLGDSGPMLDAQAKQEYKRQLRELNEELEDQRDRGNLERAEKIESEIDFLNREIARAVGLGGRDRRAGSAAERARLNVTRAIKVALQKISEQQAPMAEVLDRSIRTGSFCSYAPDPRVPVTWRFSIEGPQASVEPERTAPFLFSRGATFLRDLTDRTTFVGREADRAALRRFLEQAAGGQGSVVMIGGPAGVGKTRIAAEICAEASQRNVLTYAGSCYDREDSVPFIPFVEILEAAIAQAPSLQEFRDGLGKEAAEMARLLPQLRRLFPEIPQPMELPPEQSRRILFNAVAGFFARTAERTPTLLVLDDLHWADEGTLSLLSHLAPLIQKIPLLIICTYRDFELRPARPLARTVDDLTRLHLLERITLGGLSQSAVAEMLRALSGREPPAAVVDLFYSYTEGNPFFVEELFRHLVDQGKLTDSAGEFRRDLKPGDIEVPQGLVLIIGRRLARLGDPTQKTLATAAVIGRSFTFQLLEASTRTEPDSLLDRVEEAEMAGLISSTVQHPDTRFAFSHELIRQTVVSGLSPARRQRLHLDVADAIERVYATELEDHAEDLCHHLWQAGNRADPFKTVRFLSIAATQAIARSAHAEAIAHLKKGLDLLASHPPSPERYQQELALQLNLGMALTSAKGYSAPEVQAAYACARKLCNEIGDSPQLPLAMLGLWAYYLVRAEFEIAGELAADTLRHAERFGDRATEMEAYLRLGITKWYIGQTIDARADLERCISLQKPELDRAHAQLYGQDPEVAARVYMGLVLWELGYADRALEVSQEGLAAARGIEHPLTLAFALFYSAWLRMERGEWSAFTALIDELETQSIARGFTMWGALGSTFRSFIFARQGESDRALARAKDGVAAYAATGAVCGIPMFLAFQAGLNIMFNRAGEALSLLTEAREASRTSGELRGETELLRLEGQLLLNLPKAATALLPAQAPSKSEEYFVRAMAISRQRGTRSHELRAAVSLARLWSAQGKIEQARQMLADTYGWFREGFETADLRRAKLLLDKLS